MYFISNVSIINITLTFACLSRCCGFGVACGAVAVFPDKPREHQRLRGRYNPDTMTTWLFSEYTSSMWLSRLPFWQYPVQPAAEAASKQTRFRSVNNFWAYDEFAHIDNWIVYSHSMIVLRYHWLVYFELILFYFVVFHLEHYSYQYYSYCEFYIVFTIIFNVLSPVCFMYHYLVPLFICI